MFVSGHSSVLTRPGFQNACLVRTVCGCAHTQRNNLAQFAREHCWCARSVKINTNAILSGSPMHRAWLWSCSIRSFDRDWDFGAVSGGVWMNRRWWQTVLGAPVLFVLFPASLFYLFYYPIFGQICFIPILFRNFLFYFGQNLEFTQFLLYFEVMWR